MTEECESSSSCLSVFFPGGRSLLNPAPSPSQDPTATALVVPDAPGALLEYYPVSLSDPNFSPEDCKPYGFEGSRVQLCIKSEGNNSFIVGFLNLLKSG